MHGDYDKGLPNSEETERQILGTIILDNEAMKGVAETLEVDDFYSPYHKKVFKAMLSLYKAASSIDPILIGEELKKDVPLESIGGISRVMGLSTAMPVLKLDDFTKLVREKSELRQLIRVCNTIARDAMNEDTEHSQVFSDAQKKINDLCLQAESGKSDEYFAPLSKIIDNEVLDALESLKKGQSPKIKTGFAQIDAATGGGIAVSDVLLIAADTGFGKSALALQLAYQIAKEGIGTAFLAGEMTNKENVLRMLSQVSGITNLNWLTHISDAQHQHLIEWAMYIRDTNIRFDSRISDLATLKTHLRSMVRRFNIKVLVIDYIQLFKLDKVDSRKRHERIAEASQEVKRIAQELGIAIIEVAQFNREGAKSAQAGLHDLEGSGQLEKDASLIFILELSEIEQFDNEVKADYREAKIRLVKGRNVGRSEIIGKFFGKTVKFQFD